MYNKMRLTSSACVLLCVLKKHDHVLSRVLVRVIVIVFRPLEAESGNEKHVTYSNPTPLSRDVLLLQYFTSGDVEADDPSVRTQRDLSAVASR